MGQEVDNVQLLCDNGVDAVQVGQYVNNRRRPS